MGNHMVFMAGNMLIENILSSCHWEAASRHLLYFNEVNQLEWVQIILIKLPQNVIWAAIWFEVRLYMPYGKDT